MTHFYNIQMDRLIYVGNTWFWNFGDRVGEELGVLVVLFGEEMGLLGGGNIVRIY